ncbi:MAG: transcription factor S [Euryarchaeota archaeon]|nr:transcription factor S [Euryarchaeota archaeon]
MEFCPKCGSLLLPQENEGKFSLICRKCGFIKDSFDHNSYRFNEAVKPRNAIVVADIEGKIDLLPKINAACKKCGNFEAYWWMQQTRAADEPETRFYRCTKCGFTWREFS